MENNSYFDGGVLGLIGINLLAFLLTLFSLGLAFPWALCLYYSWHFKHTVIDGKRLKFIGTGSSLFLNYIIWLILFIITFGIYGFWISIKFRKWVVKNTHFI